MTKRILKNDFLQIEYSTTSLRITGLIPAGRGNLLVDLSDAPPVSTPFGEFRFEGGHRLWHAPEAMPRSYIPEHDVKITEQMNGVILELPTEPGTGIRKRIEIQLASGQPSLVLTHTLTNDGMWPVELAPWAISQFRLGGTVILPMPVGNADPAGLLSNRHLVLWPYTRIKDPRLNLGDEYIVFKADALPPFKIGYFNPHGWMAYWMDGVLFHKSFHVHTSSMHPDNNCNCEVYCNQQFVELESLAPLITLASGGSVSHVETWEVFDQMDILPEEAQRLLAG
jgi:hypothetical protein